MIEKLLTIPPIVLVMVIVLLVVSVLVFVFVSQNAKSVMQGKGRNYYEKRN